MDAMTKRSSFDYRPTENEAFAESFKTDVLMNNTLPAVIRTNFLVGDPFIPYDKG